MNPWGYEAEPDDLLSPDAFPDMKDEDGFDAALKAACAMVRNLCGWHVAPVCDCTATVPASGKILRLPCRALESVSKVSEEGTELASEGYQMRRDGLLRRAGRDMWADGFTGVTVEYRAGFEECPAELVEVVRSLINACLNTSAGVSSEAAGGVSISYDTSMRGAVDALDSQGLAQILAPYRVVDSHAL